MRTTTIKACVVTIALQLVLLSCGGQEMGWIAPDEAKAEKTTDGIAGELAVDESTDSRVSQIRPGDIIVVSDESGRGCWYLNRLENMVTNLRYCHALLVVAVDQDVPQRNVTVIEAFNSRQGVGVTTLWQQLAPYYAKLAVLRVVGKEGVPLPGELVQFAIDTALQWEGGPYAEPPLSDTGDPLEDGLYCSFLPFRAYLDGLGIRLDGGMTPFIVTPDDLYDTARTVVVYQTSNESDAS